MESISELKPIFLRFFQEVDGLKQKIKEQEAEIKRLRGENGIYAKVIRMNEVETGSQSNTVISEEEVPVVAVKRGRKRKYNSDEERREMRKEYNRNYRQKHKEAE